MAASASWATPCAILPPERLSDRLVRVGVLPETGDRSLRETVHIGYLLEERKPWVGQNRALDTVVAALRDNYELVTQPGALDDHFERLLKEVNRALGALSDEGETDWIGNLNGFIFVGIRDELHFTQTGHAPAYLLQRNRMRLLTDLPSGSETPHPLRTFATIASGQLELGDQLIVGNDELYHEISLDALRRTLTTASPYQACRSIATELRRPKNPGVATLVFKASSTESKGEPEQVLLAEALEGSLAKFVRKSKPLAKAIGSGIRKTATTVGTATSKASKQAAATTTSVTQKHLLPAAKQAGKVVQERFVSHEPEEADALQDTDVVETIHPKQRRSIPSSRRFSLPAFHLPPSFLALVRRLPWRSLALPALALLLVGITVLAVSRRAGKTDSGATKQEVVEKLDTLSTNLKTALANGETATATSLVVEGDKLARELATSGDASSYFATLDAARDQLTNTTRLSNPTVLPFSEAAGIGAVSQGAYTYSATKNAIASVAKGAESVLTPIPGGNPVVSLTESSDSSGVAYALVGRGGGVYRISQSGSTTAVTSISPADDTFKVGDAIASFAGNLYILDGKTGLVWRYRGTNGVFQKSESIIDVNQYDIRDTIDIAIDGSIYLLKSDGSVLKFTRGVQEASFSLTGTPDLLNVRKATAIRGTDRTPSIYLLDPGISEESYGSSRILEYTKEGVFVRAYALPSNLTQITAFSIAPREQRLTVINGNEALEFTF